jgi:SAM-dependent methyltransferase
MTNGETKKIVRETYGKIAQTKGGCGCGPSGSSAQEMAKLIGYSDNELQHIPKEANLGLGCGNPTALAGLRKGETVLDLGSGAGFDVFLASARVGETGRVIGVDMTPEMLERARENAKKSGKKNVEFRLGEIENLPVADNSVDVVISNCVINLSTDKQKVFEDIHRVLKKGGRVSISDMALQKELPIEIKNNMESYVSCVSGALLIDEYKRIVKSSGLKDVTIKVNSVGNCGGSNPLGVVSVNVEGYK